MKILHTSDLHLGIYLFRENLLPRQDEIAEELLLAAEKSGAECIIMAGDIYDSKNPSADSVKACDRMIDRLFSAEKPLPVIMISGNHDNSARLSVYSSPLEKCGLYIRGSFGDYLRPVRLGDVEIYCIPHFTLQEAKWEFDGEDAELKSISEAYALMCGRIRESWDESCRHILVTHCFAAGSEISDSERACRNLSAGGTSAVDPSVFAGFDYVALGHLHKSQNVRCAADGNTLIRYSGTPMPYSFGEASNKKSCTVYDTETGDISELELPEKIKLVTLTGSFSEIRAAAQTVPDGAFVKVILTDRLSAAGLSDELYSLFPNMLNAECRMNAAEKTGSDRLDSFDIRRMTFSALAESFMRDIHGTEITDEQKLWLDEALSALGLDERGGQDDPDKT